MAIKALLRKNTPEIREKIRKLGIPCTHFPDSNLLYVESINEVTWHNGICTVDTYDCKEDENLFFYLMSLNTKNDIEMKNIRENLDYFKSEYEKYLNKYFEEATKRERIEQERDSYMTQLNRVLEAYEYKTLEKENEELKKLINILQEQNCSLIANEIEQIHGILRKM